MALDVDEDLIEEISSRLDLREPNREALESLLFELSQHYSLDKKAAPFEAVIDAATGVGKTYIIAAAIEYLAARGVRNFAVVAPGRTILGKTVANFTPGHPKNLLDSMRALPLLVTAENFSSPAIRAAMDDDVQTKLYVFTVQSLTAPTTKQGRKTHEFQEGLGAGFYSHLARLDDLVVFADEHHCYFGEVFSAAIKDLHPHAIVGLTATPDPKTPDDQIIYRYPLAAAIAEKWVKTPVIVGRRDDRADAMTKLSDGLALLSYKDEALEAYCVETGSPRVNPVMLLIAKDTAEADEFREVLASHEFESGRWADTILLVHSKLKGEEKERALADLAAVEEPDSKVRIIVSVGMLKEGWDVKNVYVIASMRPSVSDVLTEQTLGRGLRLPFGKHTGIELLDTVEVVAHERYADLLKKANILNEQFVDKRTRALLRQNAQGEVVVVSETENVATPVIGTDADPTAQGDTDIAQEASMSGAAAVESVEDRKKTAATETSDLTMVQWFAPREGTPVVEVPILRMTKVEARFSLADIVDLEPFRKLGTQIAANPDTELQRVKVSAKVVTGRDGLRRTELVTSTAVDRLEASARLLPLEELVSELTDAVLSVPVVPQRADQAKQVGPIIAAFLDGLGPKAEELLSAFGDRAAARLVALVTTEHRKALVAPHFENVVEITKLDRVRASKRAVHEDRTGAFSRSLAYSGWKRSLYPADWFDSSPERAVANIVDDSEDVACWVRLQTGELPILWRSDGREYNADLIVADKDGTRWVVEVKSDKDMDSADVQGKRTAALKWANYVNSSDAVDPTWRYLLVGETDITQAKHSWSALKKLGS
jgi:type III restriction enzyme